MKPKENTIDKIDKLYDTLAEYPKASLNLTLAEAVQQRCHTMNIHKAKVVYFKRIKLMLTRALELTVQEDTTPNLDLRKEITQVERELRAQLDASNG